MLSSIDRSASAYRPSAPYVRELHARLAPGAAVVYRPYESLLVPDPNMFGGTIDVVRSAQAEGATVHTVDIRNRAGGRSNVPLQLVVERAVLRVSAQTYRQRHHF